MKVDKEVRVIFLATSRLDIHLLINTIRNTRYHNLFIIGYFDGIVENLHLMPYYYPGWIMRLYHDLSSDDPKMKVNYD